MIEMDGKATRVYRRRRRVTAWLRFGDRLVVRGIARFTGCMLLLLAIGFGLAKGGHLASSGGEDQTLLGRFAVMLGRSAQTIRIVGLERQQPRTVLAALGMEPGTSLIGFDPEQASQRLENIDWVEKAEIRTVFPNQLEIEIVERQPFALWQRDGSYYVIDRTGVAMSMDPGVLVSRLPLVAGEGAQKAVFELVNQLASYFSLGSKLQGASRVGGRRWNLYFPNNVKVMLPEAGMNKALAWIERLDREQGLLAKGIVSIDLRIEDRVVVVPAIEPGMDASGKSVNVAGSRD
jgi:cell division protein FtsQ